VIFSSEEAVDEAQTPATRLPCWDKLLIGCPECGVKFTSKEKKFRGSSEASSSPQVPRPHEDASTSGSGISLISCACDQLYQSLADVPYLIFPCPSNPSIAVRYILHSDRFYTSRLHNVHFLTYQDGARACGRVRPGGPSRRYLDSC
jgi:hypothetical protein